MNHHAWRAMASFAGIVGLAGCAGGGAPGMTAGPPAVATSPCTGQVEEVTINQVAISGSTASIKVDPGERPIAATGGGVRWKFNQNGYSFTGDGVTFKPAQPAGPASAPATVSATRIVWCFNNTSSTPNATWSYTIKFSADAAPSKIWSCDPTIVNRSTFTPLAVDTVACTSPP